MAFMRRALFWILTCALFLCNNADIPNPIRGVPGKDYPDYSTIPVTSFRCSKEHDIPGFYADPETRCQVFHFCFEHRQESFMCPSGTIFNEAIQACDYWYSAECSSTPLHYDTDPPNNVIAYDHEVEFIPVKSSPENVFDKMASLYQLDNSPTDFKQYTDPLEGNLVFSDQEHELVTNNRESKGIEGHLDRRDLFYDDYSGEHGQIQEAKNMEDLKVTDFLEDSMDFSGESEVPEEVFHEDRYLVPSDVKHQYENQQFEYSEDQGEVKIPHDQHYYEDATYDNSYSDNELEDTLEEVSGAFDISTKEDFMSEDKLIKRQLDTEKPFRKKSRRKPIFKIIEPHEAISTTEPTDEVSKSSQYLSDDVTTLASKDTESEFKLAETINKGKRRRRPVMLDLENSPSYDIGHSGDDTKTSNINYDVFPDMQLPGHSIAAHEIAVQLLPTEVRRKRKHFNYLPNLYDTGEDGKSDEQTFIDATSPESNIYYETSTSPALKEIESSKEDGVVKSRPIRKKNPIRILDSEDYTVESKGPTVTTLQLQDIDFENETTTQSIEKEFQEIDNFPDSEIQLGDSSEGTEIVNKHTISHDISSKEYIVETDPSDFVTELDAATDAYNFEQFTSTVNPASNFKMSQGMYQTNYPDIQPNYPDHILKTGQSNKLNKLEEKPVTLSFRNIDDFELNMQDEMLDEPYVTTEYFSEISTNMPIEIQNTESSASQYYFIPQSNFEPDYDYLDITDSTTSPVEVDFEEHAKFHDSDFIDKHPPYQTYSEDMKFADTVTERSNLEDIELQTIFNDFNESPEELIQTSKSREDNVSYKNRTSITNTSQNIMHTYDQHYGEESILSDHILDDEFQKYLHHSNVKSSETNVKETLTVMPEPNTSTTMPSIEIEQFLLNEAVDFKSVTHQDDDLEDRTDAMTNWGENYEDETDQTEESVKHIDYQTDANMNMYLIDKFGSKTAATKEQVPSFEDQMNAMKDWDENFEEETVATEERIQNFEDSTNVIKEDNRNFEDETYAINNYLQDENDSVTGWDVDLKHQTPPQDYFSNNGNLHQTHVDDSYTKLSKNIANKGDASQIGNDYQVKYSENMANSKQPIIPSSVENIPKDSALKVPLRKKRALVSPDQMDFNIRELGSQYLASLPSSIRKLKQDNIPKDFNIRDIGSQYLANLQSSQYLSNLPSSVLKLKQDITPKNFDIRDLGSQYLANLQTSQYLASLQSSKYISGLPSSVLKLKQDNTPKFLPYAMHALEEFAYISRTRDLLESQKIAKLIAIGKNLLRSKKAKYRILSRYVKSLKKDHKKYL